MFRRLCTLEEARQAINRHFRPKPLGVEDVPLSEAFNRVLAENVIAKLDIPPFNRSTVDGYAVRARDTFGADESNPVTLKICGTVNAGEPTKIKITRRSAAEIVTGAPIPEGADAVVMVEHTERKKNSIYVYSAAVKDENVMKAGADIKTNEKVLDVGKMLGPREIGVLAALGMEKVKVHAVPKVAVLSTGAEVTELGKRLPPGKVYDINAYSLSAAVQENYGKPTYLGVIADDASELQSALERALASADMVVTSGGVSVGPKDLLPRVLNSLGKPGVIVYGIAIKPGKPTTIALIDGKLVFSLPGHPTSALLVFHLLVRALLHHMAGVEVEDNFRTEAFVGTAMFAAKGRRTFIMVKLERDKADRLVAQPVPTGLSGAITTLQKADGFVEIAENKQFIPADVEVTVQLFKRQTVRGS